MRHSSEGLAAHARKGWSGAVTVSHSTQPVVPLSTVSSPIIPIAITLVIMDPSLVQWGSYYPPERCPQASTEQKVWDEHRGVGEFVCGQCLARFAFCSDWQNHLSAASLGSDLGECRFRALQISAVTSGETDSQRGSYCDPCQRQFKDALALQSHLQSSLRHKGDGKRKAAARNKHDPVAFPIEKPEPGLGTSYHHSHNIPSVTDEGILGAAPFGVGGTNTEIYICDQCLEVFVVRDEWKKHRNRRSFTCEKCLEEFLSCFDWQRHMNAAYSGRDLGACRRQALRRNSAATSGRGTEGATSQRLSDDNILRSHFERSEQHQDKGKTKAATGTGTRQTLQCRYCYLVLPTATAFKDHMEISHYSPESILYTVDGKALASQRGEVTVKSRSRASPVDNVFVGTASKSVSPEAAGQVAPGLSFIQSLKFQYGQNTWSLIPENDDMYEDLRTLCSPVEWLASNGYVVAPYTKEGLRGFQKCSRCKESRKRLAGRGKTKCVYHPGKSRRKQRNKKTTAVMTAEDHDFEPLGADVKQRNFALTPKGNPALKRRAVVVDCEMGQIKGGERELIQLVAMDYFTGAVLVNTIVKSKVTIVDYSTKYSGITAAMVDNAVRSGQYLDGWQKARQELWKYIDPDTILIGQSLKHDLEVLRMIHTVVFDTAIVIPKLPGRKHSLQALCSEFLGKAVQQGGGTMGHDCVEDVLATRELAIWCTRNVQALEERALEAEKLQQLADEAWRRKKLEKEKDVGATIGVPSASQQVQ